MSQNPSDRPTTPRSQIDNDSPREKASPEIKQQSGRAPARPPYEQHLRSSKVAK